MENVGLSRLDALLTSSGNGPNAVRPRLHMATNSRSRRADRSYIRINHGKFR